MLVSAAETFCESFSGGAEGIVDITETGAETEAVRDVKVTAEAQEDKPEFESTAAELSELEEVPRDESPGVPGGVLSPVVIGLFWRGARLRNVTGRPNKYARRTQGSSEWSGLREHLPYSKVSKVGLTRI